MVPTLSRYHLRMSALVFGFEAPLASGPLTRSVSVLDGRRGRTREAPVSKASSRRVEDDWDVESVRVGLDGDSVRAGREEEEEDVFFGGDLGGAASLREDEKFGFRGIFMGAFARGYGSLCDVRIIGQATNELRAVPT